MHEMWIVIKFDAVFGVESVSKSISNPTHVNRVIRRLASIRVEICCSVAVIFLSIHYKDIHRFVMLHQEPMIKAHLKNEGLKCVATHFEGNRACLANAHYLLTSQVTNFSAISECSLPIGCAGQILEWSSYLLIASLWC